MKSKAIPILLVLIMLTVATGVFAEGQPKTGVCHLDEYGNYQLINIADPAVQAHLAHGDVMPGTGGFDATCEPIQQPYPAGCFLYAGSFYVYLNGGSAVEDITNAKGFSDETCATYVTDWMPQYAIRAADLDAAKALCEAAVPDGWYWEVKTSPTPGLYRCPYLN